MKIKAQVKVHAGSAATAATAAGAAGNGKGKKRKRNKRSGVIRSITLPVARPLGMTWEDVRQVLDPAMRESRHLHNWLVRLIVRVDSAPPLIVDGQKRLPPMPDINTNGTPADDLVRSLCEGLNIYKSACCQAPHMNVNTVNRILQDVLSAYRADRLDVFHGNRALRQYKTSILPGIVKLKGGPLREVDGGLQLLFPFYKDDGSMLWTTWAIKAGGHRYGRAAAGARKIARGEVECPIVYLLEKPRKDGNGSDLFVKLVARFPARENKDATEDLLVSTHADGLLRYFVAGDRRVSWLRYDHVRRLLAQRRKRQNRLRDDVRTTSPIEGTHRQRRRLRAKRQRMYEGLDRRVAGIGRALDHAIKCAAKDLVGAAVRRSCKRLIYRDVIRVDDGKGREAVALYGVFAPELAWYSLRQRIDVLCKENSIEFVHDTQARLVPLEPKLEEKEVQALASERSQIEGHCAVQTALEVERRQAQPAELTAPETAGEVTK